MQLLFFDLEYASSKENIKNICEFGYVVTDESFSIVERDNYIIDPGIRRSEWDWRVVRQILTRKIEEYEKQPTFPAFYSCIEELLSKSDYIFGHSTSGDAEALNDDCRKYKLPSLNYDFYDINEIYMEYSNSQKSVSVENMLKALKVDGEGRQHDAGTDAYNTMLELKKMVETLDVTVTDIIQLCPKAHDRSENYSIKSKKQREKDRYDSAGNRIVYSSGDSSKVTLGDMFKGVFEKLLGEDSK